MRFYFVTLFENLHCGLFVTFVELIRVKEEEDSPTVREQRVNSYNPISTTNVLVETIKKSCIYIMFTFEFLLIANHHRGSSPKAMINILYKISFGSNFNWYCKSFFHSCLLQSAANMVTKCGSFSFLQSEANIVTFCGSSLCYKVPQNVLQSEAVVTK